MTDISRIDLNLLTVLDAIYTEGGVTIWCVRIQGRQELVTKGLGRGSAAPGCAAVTRLQ